MAAASSVLVLLLLSLCASISVCGSSGGQVRSQKLWGGRRGLLSLDDEVDELADLLPKKKVSMAKEEPQLKKKKLSTEEVEEVKPKKKKTGLDESEEQLPKKKKNTVDELEEAVPKKKKATIEELEEAKLKKKKAVNEELEGKQPKKKEIPIEEENQQQPKKKVKIPIEEDDEQLKMKKKKISMEGQGEELPKKKKTTIESIDQTKVIKAIKDTKNQTKSPSNSTTPKSKNMNPITNQSKDSKPNSPPTKKTTPSKTQLSKSKNSLPSFDSESDEDLLSQFSDLPSNFHSDFDRISTTSKLYLNRANVEISQSFKPLVGSKYASMVASVSSYIFLLAPFIILSLLYSRIRAHFLPLQTILLFVQIYLSIYFSILSLSFLVTGLEPLKFFYATSAASYVYTQVLQTLAYVFYLLVLVMFLVVVFSSKEGGLGPKIVGLAQMMVGLGVGVHYYVAVSHRAVMREPPMTSWKSHAMYAALFMGVCLLARAERRKKAYLQEGDEGGKTN